MTMKFSKPNRIGVVFGALIWVALPAASYGKDGQDPLASLTACRAVVDGAARVACYDQAVDALSVAVSRKDIAIVNKEQVREGRKGLFGFNIGKLPIFGGGDDEPESNTLVTTITSVRELPYGKWRFVVDGGAIWETVEVITQRRDPSVGAKVELKKGAMGAYFIKVDGGRATRAKRVN
jgi:hypothetical protein